VRNKHNVDAQVQAEPIELLHTPTETRQATMLREQEPQLPDTYVVKQAEEFSVVGKSIPRVEGYDKVTGRAQFTDDIDLHGLVYARVLASPIAHGKIKKVDISQAEQLPGVLAVMTGKDCPKPYSVDDFTPTETALAVDKVRYFGEGVAAVVALDEQTASEALRLIDVEYEELPPLVNAREAVVQTDNLIHDHAERNINHIAEQSFGDVDDAIARADVVVEETFYTTSSQCGFLEPQSVIADYDPGAEKLTVYNCNQLPHMLQRTISNTLDMPFDNIRIIVPHIGGAFGGKSEATPSVLSASFLSRKLGRPVKLTYDRDEVFYQNKSRHPCHLKLRMGFKKDGTIEAQDLSVLLDGGANCGWGYVVLWFIGALTQLPYKVRNIRYNGRHVYTNKPSPGAQRSFGGVQARTAVESCLDMAAEKLGINPYELRMINAVESGYSCPSVVECRHSEFKKCLTSVAKRSKFVDKHGKLPHGRGIGLAAGHYSSGGAFLLYNSSRAHSTANIRVDTEAAITVFCGVTDLGQGSTTVMTQIAAEVFGVPTEKVNFICQDTLLAPMDNGTMDSRATYGAGHAVKNAALDAKKKILEVAGVQLGVRAEQLECRDEKIYSIYDKRKSMSFWDAVSKYQDIVGTVFGTGDYTPPQPKAGYPGNNIIGPSPAFGFTAQIAEVDVDLRTGQVKILRYYEATDCGKAINPASVEGQVVGGISMGLGQALMEEIVVDRQGRVLNPNFHDYKIPTTMDMPDMDSEIVDSYDPTSAFGGKEVGEAPTGPVCAVLLNAVYDAIGIRFTELPLTPEKVFRAMRGENPLGPEMDATIIGFANANYQSFPSGVGRSEKST
jgi:4-hydroxybenzoyl-CoA reductase subunit alpha